MPWNQISSTLKHDTRLVISMLQKEPWTYKITKVNDTFTKGIIAFVVKQDKFEPLHDYVQIDPSKDDYGDMYADLFETTTPWVDNNEIKEVYGYELSIKTTNSFIKLNGSKILEAKIVDAENRDITNEFDPLECTWRVMLQGDDTGEISKNLILFDYEYMKKNNFKCKFKFLGDETYLTQNIYVTCMIDDFSSTTSLEITAL